MWDDGKGNGGGRLPPFPSSYRPPRSYYFYFYFYPEHLAHGGEPKPRRDLEPPIDPTRAAHINTYASMRNMRLNEKKCKDMVINFLKYQPTVITPIQLNGIVIERVSSYKLLGVIITNDLSWNEHCDSIYKKATKRLFVLRTLKRVCLGTNDLVLVYCSIVRSIVEYASPVWAAIPLYLDELIESVQRKALKIIFGRVDCTEALVLAGLESLSNTRRVGACKRFMATAR